MRVVEGTPASQLHPAVASALKLPMPEAGGTTLNAPPVAPPPPPVAPGPPDSVNRGVALPPTATPAVAPAPPTTQNPPAAPLKPGDMPPGSTESVAPNPQPQDFNHLNYDDDPILQLARQRAASQDSGAAADTLAQFQQMLLGYGSSSLARDVLGKLGNDTDFRRSLGDTLWNQFQAGVPDLYSQIDANADPNTGLSTLAQLAHQNQVQGHSQDESYNQGNLFFSGAHGNAINELARNYAFSQAGAQQDVLAKLAQARTGLLGKLNADQNSVTDAESAAYQRRVDEALKYQTGDGGSGKPPPTDDGGKKPPPAKAPPAKPPMSGPPDDRARKGANPPPPAGDKRPKSTTYKGRH